MTVFTISDSTIDLVKKKRIWTIILTVIISITVWGSLSFFAMKDVDIKIFFITICSSIIVISLILFFLLRFSIKLLVKEMKSIQYIIDDNKLKILKNNFEQFIISKYEIKCINKYKNNVIIIILNTNKNIIVDKYLDNIDQLIENLNILSPVNKIDKNPSKIKDILTGAIFVIIISAFFITENVIIVTILGIIAITYSIFYYFYGLMDKKRKKFLMIGAIIVVILKIIEKIL